MEQQELLEDTADDKATYEVVRVEWRLFGKALWPIYIHTQPINWRGPEVSDKLPWEE